MTEPARDNPGVIAFPPLLFGATLVAALVAHWFFPRPVLSNLVARPLGGLLFIGGMLLAGWGRSAMVKAGTNVDPRQPTTAIVTTGPFAHTRNPLYIALTLVYLGIALLVNALWPVALLTPLVVLTHYGIVRREERYLEAKFGDEYRTYCARVIRWL